MNDQMKANVELIYSDRTWLRIMEAVSLGKISIDDPSVQAWANYRIALRPIANGDGGALPEKPAYVPVA